MATEYYTISDATLYQVCEIIRATRPTDDAATLVASVREFCLTDWAEGDEHQEWLDTATPAEIADWVLAGLIVAIEPTEDDEPIYSPVHDY